GRLRVQNNVPTALGAAGIWLITHNEISFFDFAYWSFVFLRARPSTHLISAARVLSFFTRPSLLGSLATGSVMSSVN
ncbi:hypothetical protein, partial [Candidatus Enterovibrio escicola]|uniref:hypothetical protein n=1 Tax=Candidatus Enterovibrio escicola TaxID=1927127 RepID=UPI001CC29F35